jgi:hypothetical protein
MNWKSVVARRARKTGWNIFITNTPGVSMASPIDSYPLGGGCDKAWFGWPCDAELERLKGDFVRAADERERKEVAEQIQFARDGGRHLRAAGRLRDPRRRPEERHRPAARAADDGVVERGEAVTSRADVLRTPASPPRPVCWGIVAVLIFLLLRLVPGDPAAIIAGDSATVEQIAQIRDGLGLNRPLVVQFGIWIANVMRGDLGESFVLKKTVAGLIAQRLEPTIALALSTILFAVLIAVPLGVLAAWRHGGWVDRALMGFSTLGFSIPVFVLVTC